MAVQIPPSAPGLDARRGAVALLDGVLVERRPLSDLTGAGGALQHVDGADRARAQRLANTTLRNVENADTVLAMFLDRRPPDTAINILRLAVVELCVLQEAAHGVVDCAVRLIQATRNPGKLGGMVNAVLRNVAVDAASLWQDLPDPRLPKWMRNRLVHQFKSEAVMAIEAAHRAGARIDISVRHDEDLDLWAERLGGTRLPTDTIRIDGTAQVTDLPGFEEGMWWVQDTAAAVAARWLAPKPGEQVLDLCAAPGGKTMQLASLGGHVTALDHAQDRMARLRQNLQRTGLEATCVSQDLLTWQPPELFDAVLLDAPCSATGTIRRHPDLLHVKTGRAMEPLFEMQSDMIDRAYAFLKPGGRMVYCTCSLLAEEGERQIKRATARLDLAIDPVPFARLGLDPAWQARDETGLRLRPDYWAERGGMDGFFITCLRKPD